MDGAKIRRFFMTDIREQEMQNRIDSLTLEKENLRYEIDCLKEQIAQLKKMAFLCQNLHWARL
jgi:hypothetical protein